MINDNNNQHSFGGTPVPVSEKLMKSLVVSWENICLSAFDNIYQLMSSYVLRTISEQFSGFEDLLKNFVMHRLITYEPDLLEILPIIR